MSAFAPKNKEEWRDTIREVIETYIGFNPRKRYINFACQTLLDIDFHDEPTISEMATLVDCIKTPFPDNRFRYKLLFRNNLA